VNVSVDMYGLKGVGVITRVINLERGIFDHCLMFELGTQIPWFGYALLGLWALSMSSSGMGTGVRK